MAALALGVVPAVAAPSAMCADINTRFASISMATGTNFASVTYSQGQFVLGDQITLVITQAPTGAAYARVMISSRDMNPMNSLSALSTDSVAPQLPGTTVLTVIADAAGTPSIEVSPSISSGMDVNLEFSITCTSVAVTPTPTPAATTSDPVVDPIVNLVQQTHTALVSQSIAVPGVQQRRGGTSGPGSFNASPSESGLVLNYATSLIQLQNHGAAGDAASALANADPLDQPFNFWIDGTGAIHARTTSGVDYWGTFGLFSAGADYLVSREVLVGVALHGDGMRDASAKSEINSRGVMAGPYVSAELTEGIFLDLATYYGKSWADVKSGNFAGSYDTQRLVATGSLKGTVDLSDQLVLTPNVAMFYLREVAGAYTLSDGATTQAGSGFDATQYRVSLGSNLAYEIELEGGQLLTPFIGANLGLIIDASNRHLFGNATTGVTYATGNGASLSANLDATADGTSFRSLGARATARLAF